MEDFDEQHEQREQAFTAAKTGFLLFGDTLPYPSPPRILAADSMGKRWPAIGEEGGEQLGAIGKYPGMLKDIIITLWLATIKHTSDLTKEEVKAKAWTVEQASLTPSKALKAAEQWATDKGIMKGDSAAYTEAYIAFWNIVKHDNASMFKVEVEGAAPDDSPPLV